LNMGLSQAGSTADTSVFPDGLPVPRRYWAIIATVLAIVMSVLDSSIANVALPSIARGFHASNAASIWVINSYQVTILAAILPLASLGEIVGYRRISLTGLVVFTVASLACAFSTSLVVLCMARVVQGLGAAGIMSVNGALVRFTYPQRLLGRAIGINAFAVAVAAAIGPTIASAVLAIAPWPWLFGINVPIGMVTFWIALRSLPFSGTTERRLNYAGAVLNVATFGLLISGLQALAHDSAETLAIIELAAAAICGVALVRHEIDRPAPIIPFDLLKIRLFSLSVATSVSSFVAQMTGLIALPFEIQRLGHSAVETGLLMTPWPVATAIAAPIAGRLSDRYPAGILGSIGLVLMATGLASLAMFPEDGAPINLMWRMALCGLGFGFFQSPNNRILIGSVPRSRSGAAGGMLGSARLLGQTLGAAGVAIWFRAYPTTGSNVVLWFGAAVAVVAALISLSRLSGPAEPAANGPT
jgi:MFS transporter, DHA2 family, multidrug resistance protein